MLKIVKTETFPLQTLDKRNAIVVVLWNQNLEIVEKIINSKEERIFLDSLKDIVNSARRFAYNSINLAQLRQNWLIGQNLVNQEQKGKSRAEYGKHIVEIASKELTKEYGKGFSERNLWKFKQFYLTFKNLHILPTVSAESTPLLSRQSNYRYSFMY